MKHLIIAAIVFASATAFASEPTKGKFIPKDELPAAIQAPAKKAPKFPGVPTCAKGRLEITDHDSEPMLTWRGANQGHRCYDAGTVYVCAAFGKLSVKCE